MTHATLPIRALGPETIRITRLRRAASARVGVCVLVALTSCTELPTTPGTASGPRVAWTQVSAGSDFTCGLTETGKAYCWGLGGDGQLGSGDSCAGLLDCVDGYGYAVVPVPVAGGHRFTSITAGWFHACGLTEGGHAYCWGAGYNGQLGVGLGVSSVFPRLVSGGHEFREISAGSYHVCGIDGSGRAWCWGSGHSGQLGDGTYADGPIPTRVAGDHVFTSISAGAHTCAITTDEKMFCWGDGQLGQLGDGTETSSTTPVQVAGDHAFVRVSAGETSTCGLVVDASALCWGDGSLGQLGSTREASAVPVFVAGGQRFTSMSVASYACGVSTQGVGYCWGSGMFPGLGGGGVGPSPIPGGLRFNSVSVGVDHACAVTPDGSAYCWGESAFGALGNGRISYEPEPSRVRDPANPQGTG